MLGGSDIYLWVKLHDLECSNGLCWSIKVFIVDSFLRAMTSLDLERWLGFYYRHDYRPVEFLHRQLLSATYMWVPLIGLLCISCHASNCYGLLILQLGRNNCFLPLECCTIFSGIMEARPQERGFQVRSSSKSSELYILSVCQ